MHQIKAVFNGNFDYIENIKISPFSRAYTFSDSVYEVIPFIIKNQYHMKNILTGCKEVQMPYL